MTIKKHYYLLSLLALVTVGAAFNTSQSVSAQVYSNGGYRQGLTDENHTCNIVKTTHNFN